MGETGRKGGYIGQAWLVIVLALLYGGALAGVQTALGPLILANKENETYDRIPDLPPGADKDKTETVNKAERLMVTGTDGEQYRVYRAVAADGATKGWVLSASGVGFVGDIELLVGLSADLSKITGLYVLSQKETPGLGNKIETPKWRGQFAGKDAVGELKVPKDAPTDPAHDIKAITSATVSSESVCDIINTAVAKFRADLAAAEKKD